MGGFLGLEVQVQQLGKAPRLVGFGGGLPLLLLLPALPLLLTMQPVLYLSPCQVRWLSPPCFRKLSMDPRFVRLVAGSLIPGAWGISSPLLGCRAGCPCLAGRAGCSSLLVAHSLWVLAEPSQTAPGQTPGGPSTQRPPPHQQRQQEQETAETTAPAARADQEAGASPPWTRPYSKRGRSPRPPTVTRTGDRPSHHHSLNLRPNRERRRATAGTAANPAGTHRAISNNAKKGPGAGRSGPCCSARSWKSCCP